MSLKIHTDDSRVDSFNIYADGVFKANVPIKYTISTNVTGGSFNGDTSINKSGTAYVTVLADSWHVLPSSVTVTGATSNYNSQTGVIILSNPTDNVAITVLCDALSLTATVAGLGNSDPSTVTFTRDSGFPTSFDTWTDEKYNIFVKIPTMYRKVLAVSDGQITSFAVATTKVDNDYEVYPVFQNGNTILPYVCIGVYCSNDYYHATSYTSAPAWCRIESSRANAQAVGTGYQQYDVHFQKLFQDLALVISQNVNFNDGTGVESYLGIQDLQHQVWIDGIAVTDGVWLVCYDPSKYVNEPTASTDGYYQLSYAEPTTSGEIQALGYDTSHKFINYPKTITSNSSYNTYYCDDFQYDSGTHPVDSLVGDKQTKSGLLRCDLSRSWTVTSFTRLCYRPIS